MSKNVSSKWGVISKKKGLLLWSLVLFGYFLFVFNWVIMNKLAGKIPDGDVDGNGWMNSFFGSTGKPSTTVTQAVNYTITAMRGLGSILAGIALTRLGHKKSVIVALALLSLALPLVFIGYLESTTGYWLFVLGRMFMAIGGTVLIVFVQPIISKAFSKNEKTTLNRINSIGFNLGAAIPLILFAITPIKNSMLDHWKIWAMVAGAIPLVILIVYLIVGVDINMETKTNENAEKDSSVKMRSSSWGAVAKTKQTWKLSIWMGGWLISVVAVILIMPLHFAQVHSQNFSKLATWEILLPIILFLVGLLPGMFLVGWFPKSNINRKPFLIIVTTLGIAFIVAAYLCTVYTESIIGTSIFMFISGILLWGVQSVALITPHEDKENSPKRVGIIISFAWGIGYFIYTIANIILAVIYDAIVGDIKSNSNIPSEQAILEQAAWIQFGIFVAMSLIMPVIAIFFKKTKDGSMKDILKEFKHSFSK